MLHLFLKRLLPIIVVTSLLFLIFFKERDKNLNVLPMYTANLSTLSESTRLQERLNITLNKPPFVSEGTIYCQVQSPWADDVFEHKVTSNMFDWTFTRRRYCHMFEIEEFLAQREQVVLICDAKTPYMTTVSRNSSDKIEEIKFGDQCLIDLIDKCCYDENKVPNVAHFVWYTKKELGFFHYLALMSLLRFMKPCLLLIHGPSIPYGKYWDSFISQTPNIIHVKRERPESVYGHKLAFREHASDLMRIEALQKYGGLYIDFDEILLRSIDPLRKYIYTQGHETTNTLGSQFILATKNATFLTKWLESYRVDYNRSWGFNALEVPWNIALQHPELIHVEGFNFTRPNWYQRHLILDKNYDWSTNYAMHLFIRKYKQPIDVDIIRTLNTTIGSVSRHVLLGNKELCIK